MNTKEKNPVIMKPMKNKSREKGKRFSMLSYHPIASLFLYIFRHLCFTTGKGNLSSLAVKYRRRDRQHLVLERALLKHIK